MKFYKILITAIAAAIATPVADACTSLIATKGASTDGSTMITYAADSHTLYGELYSQPAADYPEGAMRRVVDWDTGKLLGEIPEVRHTFATVGNMNEHGLTIAESTWSPRKELEAGSGLIDYGSLIYITLQRARTAREAIEVMTGLVRDYGFASGGESFSIADADEVWIMEMVSKGTANKGAVWVARLVPDGYISGHANHSRIHTFPLKDPDTLYSPDVIDFARSQGYFNGDDDEFDFSHTYAITDQGALRGCDARVWAYYNKFLNDKAADQWLPWVLEGKGEIMPLWVIPSRKVSADDLKWMMRDHFDDTPFDMHNDIGAGPFDVPYRWRPMYFEVDGKQYLNERAIATQQTGFSFVSSMNALRPAAMRGVLWFGVDDANTGVYVPVFNSNTAVPHELAVGNGDLLTLSWTSMFWVNNYVSNQAYNRYSQMIPDIRRVQNGFEKALTSEVESLVAELQNASYADAEARLTGVTLRAANEVTTAYKQLGDFLLVKFLDGNVKKQNEDGSFQRSEDGMPVYPNFPGYNQRYYRSIVNEQGDRLKVNE